MKSRYGTAIPVLLAAAIPAGAAHELDGRDVSGGQVVYAEQCASCHGEALEGQENWQSPGDDGILPAPPHDASGHTWHHDNETLLSYTQLGGEAFLATRGITGFKSGMPAFGEVLSDDEIRDVLAFIRSTWPQRIQALQASRNPPHN